MSMWHLLKCGGLPPLGRDAAPRPDRPAGWTAGSTVPADPAARLYQKTSRNACPTFALSH